MRALRIAALTVVAFLAVATCVDLARRLGSTCQIEHNVGVYLSLAELARAGLIYPRPTAELCYVTLYQPLGFLPYALLPASGVELIPWMRALVRFEVLLSLVGIGCLLRRLRVDALAGAGAMLLLLAATPVSAAFLTCTDDPRGGLLAMTAFAVFQSRGGDVRPWRAAPVFALAFFTKLTAPIAAGLAALMAARQASAGRAGGVLLGACALWAGAGYAVAHLVLGWDLAGNGLRNALFDPKPGRALSLHAAHFGRDLLCEPVTAVLLLGAVAVAVWRAWRRTFDAYEAWFVAAFVRAFVEYRSHGTELNHLLEPCLLGALVLARACRGRVPALGVILAVPVIALVGRPVLREPLGDPTPIARSPVAVAAAVLRGQPAAPTLCEDPLLGWLAGARPFLTDPFLVSLVWRREPHLREAWFSAASPTKLQRLVLLGNIESGHRPADDWYAHLHFDAQFLTDVRVGFRVLVPSDFGTVLVRR